MADTNIEWTDKVWNPVTGCRPYSAGCANCYAQVQSHIRGANPMPAMQRKYHGLTVLNSHGRPTFTGEVRTHEDALDAPLKVKKPTTWFVNSMSDLFYGDEKDQRAAEAKGYPFTPVPFEFVDKVFAVMALCPQHTFQVLTKRAGRMAEYFNDLDRRRKAYDVDETEHEEFLIQSLFDQNENGDDDDGDPVFHRSLEWLKKYNIRNLGWPLPNVWLGVSVEDQPQFDLRAPELEKLARAGWTTFMSGEPLLGPIRFRSSMYWDDESPKSCWLDWFIVGGESGHGARPMHPDWARSIRDQCQEAGVPFFFKQWGDWAPEEVAGKYGKHTLAGHVGLNGQFNGKIWGTNPPPALMVHVGKKAAGRLLDGREWNEMPARQAVAS